MIEGLVQIFIWQGIGEMVSKFLIPSIPGPVIGLILLVMFLSFKGEVNPSLGMVADAFRQHLALLFVPASVGVILFLPELKTHAFAVGTALIISVILAIAVTALVLKLFSIKEPAYENTKAYRHEMKLLDEDRRQQIATRKQAKKKQRQRKNSARKVEGKNDR
ncbi:MAG: CidA/LrgA family protein [Methylophilaceae bacterium]